jgi:flagellar basal-body rod protein FlgC
MDFFSAMKTSASGLTAQRLRMNLISSNLAHMNTTRTAEGGPYRRLEPVFSAVQENGEFSTQLQDAMKNSPAQVEVTDIVQDPRPPRVEYDPSHPDADEEGYVKYPQINTVEEMANMIAAARSYEANVTAVSMAKSMAQKALEIGK